MSNGSEVLIYRYDTPFFSGCLPKKILQGRFYRAPFKFYSFTEVKIHIVSYKWFLKVPYLLPTVKSSFNQRILPMLNKTISGNVPRLFIQNIRLLPAKKWVWNSILISTKEISGLFLTLPRSLGKKCLSYTANIYSGN